ncbi:hypothetical protein [Terrimonas alba]|uniref:hypothetical protein n=1 Tax=Terrimonas alba TaxID=3349636 RepID=UPI0035F27878
MTEPLSPAEEILLFIDKAGYGNWVMISDKLLEMYPVRNDNDLEQAREDSRPPHQLLAHLVQDELIQLDGNKYGHLGSSSAGVAITLTRAKITVRLLPKGREFAKEIKQKIKEEIESAHQSPVHIKDSILNMGGVFHNSPQSAGASSFQQNTVKAPAKAAIINKIIIGIIIGLAVLLIGHYVLKIG